MTESSHLALREALGQAHAHLPDLKPLNEEHQADLARRLQAARAREQRELAEAMEQSLSYVPRLLRGAVRKVLMG